MCGDASATAFAPFLLAERGLVLEPAQEERLGAQAVAVAGRLEQLDLGNNLKLLRGEKKGRKEGQRRRKPQRERLGDSAEATHPASLLKVDEATLRRETERRQPIQCIAYQQPLGQTATGQSARKARRQKIPHAVMESYAAPTRAGLSDLPRRFTSRTLALRRQQTHTRTAGKFEQPGNKNLYEI